MNLSKEWSRQALKVLENNIAFTKLVNRSWDGTEWVPPTRWERIKWAVTDYFSNLWAAICGRRDDY